MPEPDRMTPVTLGSTVAVAAATSTAAGTATLAGTTGIDFLAALGGSGAAAGGTSAGFLGIGPVGWVVIGVAIIGSFLLRGKRRGPPPEAQGIRLAQPVDPNAPWLAAYGSRWYAPPLLSTWVAPATMNSLSTSRKNRVVRMHHAGAGQISGADLKLKIGNRQLFDEVTLDSPVEQRTLSAVPGSGNKSFLFPAADIEPESVSIYVDGVLVWTASGGSVEVSDKETVAPSFCAATMFSASGGLLSTAIKDFTMGNFAVRTGCILPKFGQIDEASVSAVLLFDKARGWTLPGSERSGFSSTVTLTADDWALGETDDARQYLWVDLKISSVLATAHVSSKAVKGFTVGYSLKTASLVINVVASADGTSQANFSEAQTGTVTATYKTKSKAGEGFRFKLTKGDTTQAPFSEESKSFFGAPQGTRRTVNVALELTKGAVRRYSSSEDVDDVVIGIDSGPRGFYGMESDGSQGGLARQLTMRFKETAASDTGATKDKDPSTGWVVLKNPHFESKFTDSVFRLADRFQGQGSWFFSLADLVEYTRTGKKPSGTANWLSPKRYDVEVTAIDSAGVNEGGMVDTDRRFSDLFFANATEIRRVGFILPRQSTLAVEYGDGMDQQDLLEAKYAGRTVVQVTSASATVDAGGLPTPRTVGYSRNPVWIACDFLTDPIIGAGRVFGWDDFDLASAYAAAAWCDETVTLRDGTTQTRSLCDIVLGEGGERRSVGDQVAYILAGSGVFAYWRGSWKFAVDEDADVVTDPVTSSGFVIDEEADCTTGGCEMDYLSTEERPTELVVEFRDAENGDAPATEVIQLPDPQPSPRVTERVQFPGVGRRSQVRHFGGILLRQMRGARRRGRCVGTVGRGLRLLMLDPGDIVYLTSARLGVTLMKVRIMSVGWGSGLRPGVEWAEHVSSAYTETFTGPNGGTTPGQRQPQENLPAPSKLQVSRVASVTFTVGGAA